MFEGNKEGEMETGNFTTESPGHKLLLSYFMNTGNESSHNISHYPDDSEGYKLPQDVQVILVCLYIMTIILSIGGNILVCYVVFALQRLRNVTNFYIVNLSIGDIIVTTICIPINLVVNLIYYYWPFGSFMCPFVMYLMLVSVMQRALTLVAMTLDKHYAFWKPFKRRFTKSEAKLSIVLIWIVSSIIALPTAIYTRIYYLPKEPGNQGLCTEVWDNHAARYWYGINVMLLQYFIPLLIMCITYVHIGIIIWGKRPPGEADNNRDMRLAASKRKTVKMLIVVVLVYAFCWLPLHAITIIGDIDETIYNHKFVHIAWLFAHWLAISNTFTNPLIYFWMNSNFRQGFKQAFQGLLCRDYSRIFSRPSAQNSSLRSASSTKSNPLIHRIGPVAGGGVGAGTGGTGGENYMLNIARYD